MKMTIPDFSRSKVLIVGDVMLDRYWQGATSRISPEAPVPVVKIEGIEERPGGAANVALNIAAVGGGATLLAYTGRDEASDVLQNQLQSMDIDCEFITLAQQKTITKLRVLSRHQQLIRLDFEDGFDAVDPRFIADGFGDLLPSHDVVVLSDYGKGTLRDVESLIQTARAADKKILIDPKGKDFSIYKNATLITPNQSEFEAVVGVCVNEDDFIRKGLALRADLNLEALLVTRSEKGMTLFVENEEPHLIPTRAQEVYDVTGAGDTVIGVLAAALAAGTSYVEAVQLANQAAGVVVGKVGTATANITELQQAMIQHEPLPTGVTTENQLLDLIDKARACGEKIVFTNGCFDILHAGHVSYLSRAAELGDRLIIAVNDDASVKRLKGDDRPINHVMQRMQVLAALNSVDWVVPFSEDTPQQIIEKLIPDVLVKGGDYQADNIVGAETVKSHGGEVIVLNFVEGCSTTTVINSILNKN